MKNQKTVAALTTAAFLVLAGSAQAKGYDLTTGTAVTKGNANAAGTVTFPTAKSFHVKGTGNDICPKDGYGAYIEFKINFVGAATPAPSARTPTSARRRPTITTSAAGSRTR